MPVTYTNRKGRLYYLCQGITRTGKPRYYFALEPKETLVDEIPSGYQVQESVNGIVSLIRMQPNLLSAEDVTAVEAILQAHPQAKRYRVSIQSKQITIYEQVGPDLAELAAGFGRAFDSDTIERMQNRYAQFQPIMRFLLTDNVRHLFTAQRMCFRGSIDDWINIGYDQPIPNLAARLISTLGSDEFYELF